MARKWIVCQSFFTILIISIIHCDRILLLCGCETVHVGRERKNILPSLNKCLLSMIWPPSEQPRFDIYMILCMAGMLVDGLADI